MGNRHSNPKPPSPKDDIDNAQRRMMQEKGLDLNKWNWAVIGQTKAGKSSMINAVRGLKDKAPGTTCYLLLVGSKADQRTRRLLQGLRPFCG